jgi:dihydrodipicolinate synthase/N-acetylneuraminate lyase
MRFPGTIRAVTPAYDRRGHVQVDRLIHDVERLLAGGVLRFAGSGATGESASLTLPKEEIPRAIASGEPSSPQAPRTRQGSNLAL